MTLGALLAIGVAGCSGDDDDSGGATAGSGGSAAGQAGSAGQGGDAGAGSSGTSGQGGAAGDAGASGASGQSGSGGASCTSFAGVYTSTGTCSTTSLFFPADVCVRQSQCDVSILLRNGGTYTGTVSGDTGTATTDKPVPQTCTTKPDGKGGITIDCKADGTTLGCAGTATPLAIADASETCCSTAQQDCADATRRCQFIIPDGKTSVSACIPVTGAVKEGQPCERTSAGLDDCEKGLFCSRAGLASTDPRVCRRYCTQSSGCPSGQGCSLYGSLPATGICEQACDPFAATSTCSAGQSCNGAFTSREGDAIGIVVECINAGTRKEGEACSFTDGCAAGMNCNGNDSTCHVLCDSKHPCAAGKTCNPFSTVAGVLVDATFGTCE